MKARFSWRVALSSIALFIGLAGVSYAIGDATSASAQPRVCAEEPGGTLPPARGRGHHPKPGLSVLYLATRCARGDRSVSLPSGAPGSRGAAGANGVPGSAGTNGTPGANGTSGSRGPTGPTGATGPIGPAGSTIFGPPFLLPLGGGTTQLPAIVLSNFGEVQLTTQVELHNPSVVSLTASATATLATSADGMTRTVPADGGATITVAPTSTVNITGLAVINGGGSGQTIVVNMSVLTSGGGLPTATATPSVTEIQAG